MDADTLRQCQERIGYFFNDESLLQLALTHSSVAPTRLESNERLEFLGDAVLGLAVCDELYSSYDQLLEGEMTKIKSSVVSRTTCCEIAQEMGLCEHVNLGKGMGSIPALPKSIAAALFEAIIGAIHVDGGFESARQFVLRYVRPFIDEAIENQHRLNYKSRLQQYAQRRWGVTPEYRLLDEKGPDHSKCFEVAVSIDGEHFPSGWGMSKKEAEQKAARNALAALDVLEEHEQEEQPTEGIEEIA